MIGFVRLAVFGLVALTVIYFLVSIYARSVERERLENRWDEDNPGGGDDAARDAYVEEGLRDYEGSLRRKLVWLVFILPTLAVLTLIYLTNFA